MPCESQKTVAMTLRLLWCTFAGWSPLFFHFWQSRNAVETFGLRFNLFKQCSEVVMRFRFCFTASKRGTHLAVSFLMPNFSCRIFCMRSVEMSTMSANSLIFTRRSAHGSWIFLIISAVVTSVGRLGFSSSKAHVQTRLNSLNQYLMVVIEGAWSL